MLSYSRFYDQVHPNKSYFERNHNEEWHPLVVVSTYLLPF